MQKSYEITLALADLKPRGSKIRFTQFDDEVYSIHINLLDMNGEAFAMPEGAEAEAFVNLVLPGGIPERGRAEITDAAKGALRYSVKGSEIAVDGAVAASVELHASGQILTWQPFEFIVHRSLKDGGAVPPEPYKHWIDGVDERLAELEMNGGGTGDSGVVVYRHTFTAPDWSPYLTYQQLTIPANVHMRGGKASVIEASRDDAEYSEAVNLSVKRYTNGDIALTADKAFAGRVSII